MYIGVLKKASFYLFVDFFGFQWDTWKLSKIVLYLTIKMKSLTIVNELICCILVVPFNASVKSSSSWPTPFTSFTWNSSRQ